jgi:hypothetical protein
MPYGEHLATCLHCGKRWRVGDCIPSVCNECYTAGHRGLGLDECPVCERERQERRQRVDEAIKKKGYVRDA